MKVLTSTCESPIYPSFAGGSPNWSDYFNYSYIACENDDNEGVNLLISKGSEVGYFCEDCIKDAIINEIKEFTLNEIVEIVKYYDEGLAEGIKQHDTVNSAVNYFVKYVSIEEWLEDFDLSIKKVNVLS